MNGKEFGRVAMATLMNYPVTYLERLRKRTKTFRHAWRCLGRYLNQKPPDSSPQRVKTKSIQDVPGGMGNLLGGHGVGHSIRKSMCPIPNSFRDRAILLYGSKTVNKKEILRTVSNISIYFSSEKVGVVYLVQYIFENSTVKFCALCNSCKDSLSAYWVFVKICGILHNTATMSVSTVTTAN
jgi:hypothetical protein